MAAGEDLTGPCCLHFMHQMIDLAETKLMVCLVRRETSPPARTTAGSAASALCG
jgi:hypothetical protein